MVTKRAMLGLCACFACGLGGVAFAQPASVLGSGNAAPRYRGRRRDGSGLPPLHHVGLVVRDRDRALAHFEHALGYGPTHPFEGVFEAKLESGPSKFTLRGGWVWMRNTAVEVVQPMDERSPHAAFLKEKGEGLHHMAYWVDSVRGEIDAMAKGGAAPRMIADASGPENPVPWCYVEGAIAGATLIELIERNPASEQVYKEVFAAIGGRIPV